jgi:SSS family solute:Na+ symporter
MFYLITFTLIYLAITVYFSYLGYRRTVTVSDYLLAGRQVHPVTMGLSYGATYISTSAIIGFGGVSALYGFGLTWLAFLNIMIGYGSPSSYSAREREKWAKPLMPIPSPNFWGDGTNQGSSRVFQDS